MLKKSRSLPLLGIVAALALTGCEQIEQAASQALQDAQQSAQQALEEARQSGSLDQARQSASEALDQARQAAAGLLGEASEYLGAEPRAAEPESPAAEDSPAAI